MKDKSSFIYMSEGIIRSFIVTLLFLLIMSVVMKFVEFSSGLLSSFILVITLLSIVYGAIYSVRKIQKKGWIVGLCVAVIYMIMVYIIAAISGSITSLALKDLIRLLLAMVVGTLSGMLGINI